MDPKFTPIQGGQRAMTLVMPIADPSYATLLSLGEQVFNPTAQASLAAALDRGGTVHFARFVVIGGNLTMVASYDGDFRDYIFMFIQKIGDVFNAIMRYVEDPPPTPVQEHPDAFVDWVSRHDQPSIGFYSNYPGFSAQQIRTSLGLGLPTDPPPPKGFQKVSPALPPDAVDDVQGLVLRGFGHALARHFFLEVVDAAAARRVLGAMAGPDPATAEVSTAASVDWSPKITTGTNWGDARPDACWALGVTGPGLRALDLPDESIESFPTTFLAGAVEAAGRVGDVGPNRPDQWIDGFQDPARLHVVVSLYTDDAEAQGHATRALEDVISGALEMLSDPFDAAVFGMQRSERDTVHFGYRDNISQPAIAGDPLRRPPDHQPLAPAGEFVLGYPSQYVGVTLDVPQPYELGRNGSFSAFRILEQDVVGFERFLEKQGATSGLGAETLAAKLMGRWRNGVPLASSPDTPAPIKPIPDDQFNNFGYADDPLGEKCPVGAHIRRGNPRDQPMLPTNTADARRITRRAMPYGPKWTPGDEPDDVPRGLVGHFICASLMLQFETVMGEWMNGGRTAPGITGTNDVVLGANPANARLEVPPEGGGDPATINNFGPFVRTRAGIYSFLPSASALRWIGQR